MRRMLWDVHITFTTVCGVCSIAEERETTVWAGGEIPMPTMPHGWKFVSGDPICPLHEIEITA